MSTPLRSVLATAVPRSAVGWAIGLLAVLLFLAGLVGLVAHVRAPGRALVLALSAFAPYLMLGAPVALVLLLLGRMWLPAVVALVLTAVCVATQLPLYVATTPPANSTTVTAMTSNLRLGGADADAVVDAVRRHDVDVLMLEELTLPEQQRLVADGLDTLLPYHESGPGGYAQGTGLWSRYPLRHAVKRTDFHLAFITATITVPHDPRPVALAAAHMAGPDPLDAYWHSDIAHLARLLPAYGAGRTAILGGDLNATPDVEQFRAVLTHGWADGAAQAGAGYTRTYPSDRGFPPLIAIDHVLTHDAVATSARTVEIPGSDHRSLVVQVAIPRS